jgi:ATP-binding cassette subfamily B protein
MLQAPFMMLGQLVMMGQRAKASAGRIFEILDESPEIVERPGAYDLLDVRGTIDFNHVTFTYDNGAEILKDFDAHIAPGETVAIVGRTGSGKSTIARLLDRFYDVTDGAITIDGHDMRDVTLTSLRENVGVVLDEPFLFSISIRDNIAYGLPDASFERSRRRPERERRRVHRPPPRGVRHRGRRAGLHALGRTAPAHRYREDAAPQSSDPHPRRRHQRDRRARGVRYLRCAARTLTQRTTIVIAHRISTIALASRVLLLDEGHVVASGTHEELLANVPLYSEILAQTTGEES